MTGQQWMNAISVAGSVLSFAGVVVAVWQIRKTRHAAEAAEAASRMAQQGIARNVLLVDVTSCVSQLDSIKGMIRSKRYDAALLRVSDLTASLIQLREVMPGDGKPIIAYKKALTQLSILRDLLELRLSVDTTAMDPVQINSVLSEVASSLHSWIGNAKYLPPEDASNA